MNKPKAGSGRRVPIPVGTRHRDRKNDWQRAEKHRKPMFGR